MDPIDLRLIELVEKCSHLYDKSSPDYKDKIKAQNAWVSIAKLLNASGVYAISFYLFICLFNSLYNVIKLIVYIIIQLLIANTDGANCENGSFVRDEH